MISLWSPSFSPMCGSCPSWLSPPSWSGALDWRLCSFSFWQGRLRRSCQLLSLWHWGHSSPPSFLSSQTLWQIWQKLSSLSSCSIRLQWFPGHSFLPGNDTADELARRGALLAPSAIPCSFSPLISRIHFCHFSDWRRTVSSKYFDPQVPSISTEELVLSRHARCVVSRLRCNGHSLLLSSYLSRIGRIKNSSCSAWGHSSQDISFCTVQLRTYCAVHSLATICLSTTSGPDPAELPGFWGFMVFRHAPIPRKGSGNQQQQQQNPTLEITGSKPMQKTSSQTSFGSLYDDTNKA